jgi:glycerol-3-phosphate dehydrogenase
MAFVVPVYSVFDFALYGAGLKMYDVLAAGRDFGRTEVLGRAETIERLPALRTDGLLGGIVYHDGQCDDARLLIQLARTAADHGAVLLNYSPVVRVDGHRVRAREVESGAEFEVEARVVINAGGPFSDDVRRLADPSAGRTVATSQGSHIVVKGSFLPGGNALMVPKTSDGRVLFAIPWLGHTLIGTTDTPVDAASPEPRPFEQEIDFILNTAELCLDRPPRREDVLASFAGIRPLVLKGSGRNTAALSRDHSIRIEPGGMLTIVGGKWTTYRSMAEDCVNKAANLGGLPARPCRTYDLAIRPLDTYEPGERLHPELPYTEGDVMHAVRFEMARTTEDVLARRTRASFLNARAARDIEPRVETLMRTAREQMEART